MDSWIDILTSLYIIELETTNYLVSCPGLENENNEPKTIH